jgi:protein ImuB
MPRPLSSLDLVFREEALPNRRPSSDRGTLLAKPQLWLAVCLPNLPFDALRHPVTRGAAVVVEAQQGQVRVVAANREAREHGIARGCKLNAALALAASLQVFERSPRIERARLESLAAWSQTLTSIVSVEPPETLLLEVSGSLKLFRSLAAIKEQLERKITARHWALRLCAAPTPLAALWLARGAAADVPSLDALSARLGALPLYVTHWPVEVQALLQDLGARTIGDCLRLPRAGFARRAGVAYLDELDRALGRSFDLRTEFASPERWSATRELYQESSSSAVLMAAVEHMLDALVAELRRRQAQVRSLKIVFEHLRIPPTFESFDWVEPTHDRERLTSLLRDRIERVVLPAPATRVSIGTGPLQTLRALPVDLFDKTPIETLAHVLLERLCGRLGLAAVYGMELSAEHRPERAWSKSTARPLEGAPPASSVPSPWAGARPLWLLPCPLPLESREARRHYRGTVEVESGPERIESGWWDERDVGRDYYTAVSSYGQRLWVFEDRLDEENREESGSAWYLHGLFG